MKKNFSYEAFSRKVKEIEAEQKDNLSLLLLVGFFYLLFGSVTYAGRILMAGTYFADTKGSEGYKSMANIQLMLYYIASPIGLQFISSLVIKLKFRLILFFAALGSQLLFLVTIYCEACVGSHLIWCNVGLIYSVSVILSVVSGIFQGILFFGILFYLTNIATIEDKPIFYGVFFLVHNFQWMTGSLFGQLIIYETEKHNNLSQYYYAVLLINFILSFLFFAIPEPSGESRLLKLKKFLYRSKKQSQDDDEKNMVRQQFLSSLRESELQNSECNLALHERTQSKSKSHPESKSIDENLSLQFFSMEESEMKQIYQGDFNKATDGISLEDYEQKPYRYKIFLTWRSLLSLNINYLIPTIVQVALIEVFILIYTFRMVYDMNPDYYDQNDAETWARDRPQIIVDTLGCILYFGIGEVIGCYAMGTMGDFMDKVKYGYLLILFLFCSYINQKITIEQQIQFINRGLLGLNLLLEIALIIGFFSFNYQIYFIICISCVLLGFCVAAISSTLISMLIYEYPYHIYMIDLIYVIYCWGQALGAALFMICNYTNLQLGFLFLIVFGIISLSCAYIYSRSNMNKQSNP